MIRIYARATFGLARDPCICQRNPNQPSPQVLNSQSFLKRDLRFLVPMIVDNWHSCLYLHHALWTIAKTTKAEVSPHLKNAQKPPTQWLGTPLQGGSDEARRERL